MLVLEDSVLLVLEERNTEQTTLKNKFTNSKKNNVAATLVCGMRMQAVICSS